jgi:hypothetical protein
VGREHHRLRVVGARDLADHVRGRLPGCPLGQRRRRAHAEGHWREAAPHRGLAQPVQIAARTLHQVGGRLIGHPRLDAQGRRAWRRRHGELRPDHDDSTTCQGYVADSSV